MDQPETINTINTNDSLPTKVKPSSSIIESEVIIAVLKNNIDELKKILNEQNVNDKTGKGITALMYAVDKEFVEIVDILISNNADVNMKANKGNTALMFASQKDDLDKDANENNQQIFDKLIKAGADVNLQNDKGKTALMYAVEYNNSTFVDRLIKAGADVNIKDKKGKNAKDYLRERRLNKMVVSKISEMLNPKIKNDMEVINNNENKTIQEVGENKTIQEVGGKKTKRKTRKSKKTRRRRHSKRRR